MPFELSTLWLSYSCTKQVISRKKQDIHIRKDQCCVIQHGKALSWSCVLTKELLEVEHGGVVFISAVGQVGHHDGCAVIFLVCPQEGHASVLALVKVIRL